MAANTVGSVRRIDRPDAVIVQVSRSRRALWAATRLFVVVLLGVATIGLAIYLSDGGIVFRNSNAADAIWRITWTCGGVLLLWWYVGRHIPPLLRTARRHVTIEVDTRWQRLDIQTDGRGDASPDHSWPSSAIEDVLISPRVGDAGELRIVPAVGRAATLFYGLRSDELEFLAAILRDALRLTARDDEEVATDVADGEEPLREDHSEPATPADHPPALDYAPPVPQALAIDRGQSGVTIYVAPLPPLTYLSDRWPLIAAMFAVIVVWGLLTDTKREILLVGVVLAFLVAIANAAACLTRTTIQLTRTRLSRLTATPLGTVDEGWASRSVRDVFVTPRPPTVELRLTGGETAVLANPATADEAEAIAAALRRALRTYMREREAAAATA